MNFTRIKHLISRENFNNLVYFPLNGRVKDGGLAKLARGDEGSDGRQPDLVG